MAICTSDCAGLKIVMVGFGDSGGHAPPENFPYRLNLECQTESSTYFDILLIIMSWYQLPGEGTLFNIETGVHSRNYVVNSGSKLISAISERYSA